MKLLPISINHLYSVSKTGYISTETPPASFHTFGSANGLEMIMYVLTEYQLPASDNGPGGLNRVDAGVVDVNPGWYN